MQGMRSTDEVTGAPPWLRQHSDQHIGAEPEAVRTPGQHVRCWRCVGACFPRFLSRRMWCSAVALCYAAARARANSLLPLAVPEHENTCSRSQRDSKTVASVFQCEVMYCSRDLLD